MASTQLYPPVLPYDNGMLDVGHGDKIYWEVVGHPTGKPAVLVHGGPGQGCLPQMRQMFDPALYRAVLFDQRGCGRSTPHASDPSTSIEHNTTQDLVQDMERLREHLGIDRWLVTGGSWGTTLALAYAEGHPHRVTEMVLSAITTGRRSEIDWLYGGAARFFPEEWELFRQGAGGGRAVVELLSAYARLLEDHDPGARAAAASSWQRWEEVVLSLEPGASPSVEQGPPSAEAVAFARLCAHYYSKGAFLAEGALLENVGALDGIPGVLVHGRLDLSCPVSTAWELSQSWLHSELLIDNNSGHRGSSTKRTWLLEALDRFATA